MDCRRIPTRSCGLQERGATPFMQNAPRQVFFWHEKFARRGESQENLKI